MKKRTYGRIFAAAMSVLLITGCGVGKQSDTGKDQAQTGRTTAAASSPMYRRTA